MKFPVRVTHELAPATELELEKLRRELASLRVNLAVATLLVVGALVFLRSALVERAK